jgi:hypothetical protein
MGDGFSLPSVCLQFVFIFGVAGDHPLREVEEVVRAVDDGQIFERIDEEMKKVIKAVLDDLQLAEGGFVDFLRLDSGVTGALLFEEIDELFGVLDDVADVLLHLGHVEVEHGLDGFDVLVDHPDQTCVVGFRTFEVVGGGEGLFEFPPSCFDDIALEVLPELRDDETEFGSEGRDSAFEDHELVFGGSFCLEGGELLFDSAGDGPPDLLEVDLGLAHGEEEFVHTREVVEEVVGEDQVEWPGDFVAEAEVAPVVTVVAGGCTDHLPLVDLGAVA